MADEVLGVRAFGSESQTEAVETRRNEIIAAMRADIEATIEWHRMGAIKGTILDADATGVIYNLFTEFGLTQQVIGMALPTAGTELLGKCNDILEAIEAALGAVQWTGARHPETRLHPCRQPPGRDRWRMGCRVAQAGA